jgi:hypothetical protein
MEKKSEKRLIFLNIEILKEIFRKTTAAPISPPLTLSPSFSFCWEHGMKRGYCSFWRYHEYQMPS